MTEASQAIFERAAERAKQMGLPYAGAVTPAEANALREAGSATLVDVRTEPEYRQVGHVPDTSLIVWPRDGDEASLGAFVAAFRKAHATDTPLLLLCRSGSRSHYAAHLLTHAGYTRAYNILEGFEGPPGSGRGWIAAGLPTEKG